MSTLTQTIEQIIYQQELAINENEKLLESLLASTASDLFSKEERKKTLRLVRRIRKEIKKERKMLEKLRKRNAGAIQLESVSADSTVSWN